MKYSILGNTGLKVSRICLGMMSYGNSKPWMIEIDQAKPIIRKALDAGINFFDTADMYSNGRSEEITGELLHDYREEVIIATKVFFPMNGNQNRPLLQGLTRHHIYNAIEGSLSRLQTKSIDLYQIHRLDPHVPIEEVIFTLNNLIRSGKILHLGASSMSAWQLMKSLCMAERYNLEPFRTMQNLYNLVYREEEREMLPLCREYNIGLIPWSPLARGFLTGKYSNNTSEITKRGTGDKLLHEYYFKQEDFEVVERIREVAKEKEVTPAQIALAWLFNKPFISAPIIGMTKIEYVDSAIEALEITLTKDEINRLEEVYKPHFVEGFT